MGASANLLKRADGPNSPPPPQTTALNGQSHFSLHFRAREHIENFPFVTDWSMGSIQVKYARLYVYVRVGLRCCGVTPRGWIAVAKTARLNSEGTGFESRTYITRLWTLYTAWFVVVPLYHLPGIFPTPPQTPPPSRLPMTPDFLIALLWLCEKRKIIRERFDKSAIQLQYKRVFHTSLEVFIL